MKDICQNFDNIQIMCESGICWNVSAAYMCEFSDVLQVRPSGSSNSFPGNWTPDNSSPSTFGPKTTRTPAEGSRDIGHREHGSR